MLIGRILPLSKKHVVKRALIQMNVHPISYNLNLTIQPIYDRIILSLREGKLDKPEWRNE